MEIRVFVCVMCVPSIWRESFFGALHGSGVADTFRALRNECVACCFCSSTRVIEMYEYYLANIDKSNMESLHLINRQVLHAHDLFCFFLVQDRDGDGGDGYSGKIAQKVIHRVRVW